MTVGGDASAQELGLNRDSGTYFFGTGTPQRLPLTTPLPVKVANQSLLHFFVQSPACPVNLLGRDILTLVGASILCSPDGVRVTFTNGHTVICSIDGLMSTSQMLLTSRCEENAR